jgi:cell division protease FtsH
MPKRSPASSKAFALAPILLCLVPLAFWSARSFVGGAEPRIVAYSELASEVEAGHVERAQLDTDRIVATLHGDGVKKAESIAADRIPRMDERGLLEAMQRQHVVVSGQKPWSIAWAPLLLLLGLPLLTLPLALLTRAGTSRRRPMTFGRSKAKLYDRGDEQGVTFADVAGVDEAKAELVEVVRFLKEPEKYAAIGAHVPKGVLLVGAPGTGKTLLARAVAGESGVPFFSMSGSEFVEMFVGVGASRVRDLFEQAKERAPCVVFIDELDALGKARGGAAGLASNEEREQTLNQLLVEMDGFAPGSGLVIMAATNRPEILDRALVRAGRFDRQVLVDRPDLRGREAIVRVHARNVKLAPGVDLMLVARRTPGMVGADLANVVNEAALASVRRDATAVTDGDFEEAMDRLQLGLKKAGLVMTDDEKRRVAFHEAGHALVALSVPHADPVHRVTIIPRSIGALGVTLQLPTDERHVLTREELEDRLCVLLGGRTAEEIACGTISTGAQDDLERATAIARQMVCRFGMSDALGPLTWGHNDGLRLVRGQEVVERDYSEETARAIDAEVRRIVEVSHTRAAGLLGARRVALDAIGRALLVRETLERVELEALAGTPRRLVTAAVA